MIGTGDLRKGATIELDGQLYSVLDYHHIKMGRGSAQVRLKLRDLRAGHIIERTFQAGEKFLRAKLDHHSVQFLYRDGDLLHFMDLETYEQTVLNLEHLGDAVNYLKDGMTLEVLTYGDEPIGAEVPLSVELVVVDAAPGFKGDTAAGGTKPATLETGLAIQVPLFINAGDVIKVDTRTGSYVERVSS